MRSSFLPWPTLILASFINTGPQLAPHSQLPSLPLLRLPLPPNVHGPLWPWRNIHGSQDLAFSPPTSLSNCPLLLRLYMSREWLSLPASTSSSPNTPLSQPLPPLKALQGRKYPSYSIPPSGNSLSPSPCYLTAHPFPLPLPALPHKSLLVNDEAQSGSSSRGLPEVSSASGYPYYSSLCPVPVLPIATRVLYLCCKHSYRHHVIEFSQQLCSVSAEL